MPDIFLSYSREDQVTARRFADALQREGLSVWWDQSLSIGEAFDQITEKALGESSAVVVLWSTKSVDSRWVRAEATQAQSSGRLAPVMIEHCKRPIMFELTQTADLSHWKGDTSDPAWQAFLSGLRRYVSKQTAGASAPPVVRSAERRPPRLRLGLAIAAFAVLAIGAVLIWQFGRQDKSVLTSAPPARSGPVSLAVLPFANLSPDPDQEYFSDGLTEEILNQLAQIPDLRVTGRTSSFSFKGRNEDLRQIATQLGVAHLLEGSIRKDGEAIRITAQLIDGADGAHLWSRSYNRELRNVFAVQEEIAKDVAQALSVRLDVGNTSRARGGTTNVEAYEKYLRAKAQFNRRQFADAARLYRDALKRDPDFVDAWYGLLLNLLPLDADGQEIGLVVDRLESLAPGSWQSQMARAVQLRQSRKWAESFAALASAEAAIPASVLDMDALLALNSIWVGRIGDGQTHVQRMLQADPLSQLSSGWLQFCLVALGRMDEAVAEHGRIRSMPGYTPEDGGRVPLVAELSYLQALWSRKDGSDAEVRAWFTSYRQQIPLLRSMSDLVADPASAREVLQRAFDDPSGTDATGMLWIAVFADHFSDRDLALAALRRMFIDMRSNYTQFLWLPYATGLRADARFKEIVREMGLADYWRSSGNWADFCKPVGTDDFECR